MVHLACTPCPVLGILEVAEVCILRHVSLYMHTPLLVNNQVGDA